MSWDKKSRKQYNPKTEGHGNPDDWQDAFKQRMYANEKKKEVILPELQELYNCETLNDLKKVYRKLVIKYHPDKAGDTKANKEMTQKIIQAYNEIKQKLI